MGKAQEVDNQSKGIVIDWPWKKNLSPAAKNIIDNQDLEQALSRIRLPDHYLEILQKWIPESSEPKQAAIIFKGTPSQQIDSIKSKPHHPSMTEPITRPELDAKLEIIEARMDGRLARIEDKFDRMEATMGEIKTMVLGQKKTIWGASVTTITLVLAAMAFFVSSFDSGRDTGKLATEAQTKSAQSQEQTARLIADAEVKAAQAQKDTAAALAEIRAIVSDLNKKQQ